MGMNKQVYAYLLGTYGREPRYWVGFVSTIIQTLLLRVVTVILLANIAGSVATGDFGAAKRYILIELGAALAGLSFRLIKEVASVRAENRVYAKLMVGYFQKLVGKDMSFFRDHQTGYLASTFRQHIDSSIELVRLFRGEFIQNTISLTIPAIVLFVASWKVGLTAVAIIIAQLAYVFWSSSVAHAERKRSHEVYRRISGIVSDDVTNIVAYKTSGSGVQSMTRLRAMAKEESTLFWLRWRKRALFDAPRDAISIVGTSVAFWVIVTNVEATATSVTLVVLTITYMFQMFQAVTHVPEMINKHDDLITKLYPTLEYVSDAYETVRDPKKPKNLLVKKARIDINAVSFSYSDTQGKQLTVFDGLDLHIKGGEQVGVVGLSGAGKSTLASLLMRFDDIDSGSITIDGVDIRDVRQDQLRENIAYVPQEPLLFHRTIRENLQYFGKDLSETHMIRAAQAAHASEFIDKLPSGYDTMVGERGVKLSGGQKQRVVIARAILKNAPIMLFDEATSALDSESEKIIQKALPKIIGKRTAIVIAHRLSTIAGLDRIIVMHEGKIVEDGTHTELLKLKGRYYSLWQKQINHDK